MEQCLTESRSAGLRTAWIAKVARMARIARMAQGLAAAAARGIRTDLSRAAMNRRVLHRLSTLSARELKDIGLTPHDVADACGPGTRDAIDLLVGRRDERRHARTATRRW